METVLSEVQKYLNRENVTKPSLLEGGIVKGLYDYTRGGLGFSNPTLLEERTSRRDNKNSVTKISSKIFRTATSSVYGLTDFTLRSPVYLGSALIMGAAVGGKYGSFVISLIGNALQGLAGKTPDPQYTVGMAVDQISMRIFDIMAKATSTMHPAAENVVIASDKEALRNFSNEKIEHVFLNVVEMIKKKHEGGAQLDNIEKIIFNNGVNGARDLYLFSNKQLYINLSDRLNALATIAYDDNQGSMLKRFSIFNTNFSKNFKQMFLVDTSMFMNRDLNSPTQFVPMVLRRLEDWGQPTQFSRAFTMLTGLNGGGQARAVSLLYSDITGDSSSNKQNESYDPSLLFSQLWDKAIDGFGNVITRLERQKRIYDELKQTHDTVEKIKGAIKGMSFNSESTIDNKIKDSYVTAIDNRGLLVKEVAVMTEALIEKDKNLSKEQKDAAIDNLHNNVQAIKDNINDLTHIIKTGFEKSDRKAALNALSKIEELTNNVVVFKVNEVLVDKTKELKLLGFIKLGEYKTGEKVPANIPKTLNYSEIFNLDKPFSQKLALSMVHAEMTQLEIADYTGARSYTGLLRGGMLLSEMFISRVNESVRDLGFNNTRLSCFEILPKNGKEAEVSTAGIKNVYNAEGIDEAKLLTLITERCLNPRIEYGPVLAMEGERFSIYRANEVADYIAREHAFYKEYGTFTDRDRLKDINRKIDMNAEPSDNSRDVVAPENGTKPAEISKEHLPKNTLFDRLDKMGLTDKLLELMKVERKLAKEEGFLKELMEGQQPHYTQHLKAFIGKFKQDVVSKHLPDSDQALKLSVVGKGGLVIEMHPGRNKGAVANIIYDAKNLISGAKKAITNNIKKIALGAVIVGALTLKHCGLLPEAKLPKFFDRDPKVPETGRIDSTKTNTAVDSSTIQQPASAKPVKTDTVVTEPVKKNAHPNKPEQEEKNQSDFDIGYVPTQINNHIATKPTFREINTAGLNV